MSTARHPNFPDIPLFSSFGSMSEITFAKSFLATLDRKSVKLGSDHVSDPKKYPSQSPVSSSYMLKTEESVLQETIVHTTKTDPSIPGTAETVRQGRQPADRLCNVETDARVF